MFLAVQLRLLTCAHIASPDCGVSSSSLSDLKGIGCKMIWAVHISPLFYAKGTTIGLKSVKIRGGLGPCPHPAHFSHRFFKSDRLLVRDKKSD
jgi:hypothetical protein